MAEVVIVMTDDTSFGDEAEVVFTNTVGSTVSQCVANHRSASEAVTVVAFATVPADATVTHDTFHTVGDKVVGTVGLGSLRLSIVSIVIVVVTPVIGHGRSHEPSK